MAGFPKPAEQDHLFISYAWEDRALADWLTLRLTAEGYRVWCDRFKMLGGERFPHHIDLAIKTQTFRLLALLSRHSLNKPNPTKERTLALAISRERGIDFMIPLNVDGLKPTELNWMLSDLSYISFTNWAEGLQQLLKRLRSLDAPRPIVEQGKQFAAEIFLPSEVLLHQPETLYTNCLRFERIPSMLRFFRFTRQPTPAELDTLSNTWAFYPLDEVRVFAFEAPDRLPRGSLELLRESPWREVQEVEGVVTINIISNLLRQSLICKLISKGLRRDPESGLIYFPPGAVKNNRIFFINERGRSVPLQTVGVRKFQGGPYRYHLAPTFRVRQDVESSFVAQLKVRLFLTDVKGNRLDAASALVRRKALTRNWFNHQWLSRQLAICAYLSEGREKIAVGQSTTDPIVLEAMPIHGDVPISINERYLAPLRKTLLPSQEDLDEDEETDWESENA